ncbi:kinase-like domain-containing protein, partial [Mycena galericulata]
GRSFLFLQLCDTDLRRYVDTHIRLDESETKFIMWQILLGLSHLHSLDISHCGRFQLENILLKFKRFCRYPAIRITDFELALRQNKAKPCPDVRGTISYLPPEAIRALDNSELKYFTEPSDCWSAGVVLFCMISCVRSPLFRQEY